YGRDRLDDYAVESHHRAARAWAEGRFARSVVPVTDRHGEVLLERDETVRPNATPEQMAGLKPAFAGLGEAGGFDRIALMRYPDLPAIAHVHHPGNSSGIVDGAAAVLIGTAKAGQAAGLRPRARIRAFAEVGSEPTIMLTGPSYAAEKALRRAGMAATDIDLWEINEAFASVVLRCVDALEIDLERVNVNGGAIAMGHPLGASGAILLGTVLDEMERRDSATALVTLCIGIGMGVATIIERV
ncbi:MAG: acetyl-CoA C-acyltransferase, partial [Alphaproteobacteria bacterium HGW-Alphaproteobacteria-2]